MSITQDDIARILKLLLVNSAGEYSALHLRGDEYGSLQVVDAVHAAIHRGKFFTHSSIHEGVAVNSYVDHVLHVTSGAEPHMRLGTVSAEGSPFWVEFYEHAQVSSLGAAAVVKNNDRHYPDANGMTIHEASIVTSYGDILFTGIVAGSTQAGGQHDFSKDEWVLQGGIDYLIRVWNKSNQAQNISLTQVWYEL